MKELRLLGDFHRYIPALARQAGGRITEIPIRNVVRPAGQSSYGLGRTVGVSLDLVLLYFLVRYMDRPLRAFGQLALLAATVGTTILGVLLLLALGVRYARPSASTAAGSSSRSCCSWPPCRSS